MIKYRTGDYKVSIYTKNVFCRKIQNENDIKKYFNLKVFGSVSIHFEEIQRLRASNDTFGSIGENINAIQKNILDSTSQNTKSILITSCNSIDEKRWIAVSIGLSFATANKKVLIIMTDMLNTNSTAFHDFRHIKRFIKPTSTVNLDIFTDDYASPSLPDINDLRNFIEHLKNFYDLIIIGDSSSNFINNSALVSSIADSTILVANLGETRLKDIKKFVYSIKQSGGAIIGTILNTYEIDKKNEKVLKRQLKDSQKERQAKKLEKKNKKQVKIIKRKNKKQAKKLNYKKRIELKEKRKQLNFLVRMRKQEKIHMQNELKLQRQKKKQMKTQMKMQIILQKQRNKEQNKLFLRLIIKKQNKHIEKLEKVISSLNKKLDNDAKLQGAINKQNELFKKEIQDNNEILKKIIEDEFVKLQENMKDEIRQDVISTQERINDVKAKIQKETQHRIKKILKDARVDSKQEIAEIQEKTNKEIEHIQESIMLDTQNKLRKIEDDKNMELNEIKINLYEKINTIQDEIKESEQKIKLAHLINDDISYEDLEKSASYIIPLN